MSSNRPVYSCIRCSDRKIKCDRQDPCGACKKHNVSCTYRPVRQTQKQQKRRKREVLIDRLLRTEAALKEQGLDLDTGSHSEPVQLDEPHGESSSPTDSSQRQQSSPSDVSELQTRLSRSQIFTERGGVKFVDNSLMTRVAEEFHEATEDPHEPTDEESDGEESEDDFDLVIGASPHRRTSHTHPPNDRIHELWQIFVENVDPLTKIVHVPSLQSALMQATSNLAAAPRSFNALMFGIYSTAVVSLKEQECLDRFAEPRSDLLSRYVAATKAELVRANFTSSTSIVVLQALILHILSIQDDYEPRSMWILTGVALRIAQSMGLHRHAGRLGLPLFEAEIRRRIWCYLRMHDNSAAEMCGQPKFRGLDEDDMMIRALANVNDDEIYPGMQAPPTESSKPTDMIFRTVMSEFYVWAESMAAMNRKHGGLNPVADDFASKESNMPSQDVIQSMEDNIETKYLRYCDPSDPLQLMTILFARYSVNVGRFMAHHPRKWKNRESMPESERKYVWNVSLKLLEQFNMMQSSPHLQRFTWHSAHYLQWWAFIHILDTLRADPVSLDSARAWRQVESTFENNPAIITNTKRSLYVAVGNLCLKAFNARETAMMAGELPKAAPPQFILRLRQEREAARIRAQARPWMKVTDVPSSVKAEPTANPPEPATRKFQGQVGSHQVASEFPPQLQAQEALPAEAAGNAYWLGDNLNESGLSGPNSMMDTSATFMITQDPSIYDTTVQDIDWTQWDAWLSGGTDVFWGDPDGSLLNG